MDWTHKVRGIAIPGLSMAASELPDVSGLLRLENPGLNGVADLSEGYRLNDIARIHSQKVADWDLSHVAGKFLVIGMSMGGMVALECAAKYRRHFPAHTRFRVLVSSPNVPEVPAIPDGLLAEWMAVRPGDVAGFERIMKPFFSSEFSAQHSEAVRNYTVYRAHGKNGQSARSFMKQVDAIRRFNATQLVSSLNQRELEFVSGEEDSVLGRAHAEAFKRLFPDSVHRMVPGLGHMVNLEMAEFFKVDC